MTSDKNREEALEIPTYPPNRFVDKSVLDRIARALHEGAPMTLEDQCLILHALKETYVAR